MSNAEIFLCDLAFFSVISVSLNNKGKYFSVIIIVVAFVNIFSVFSVSQKFSVWFSESKFNDNMTKYNQLNDEFWICNLSFN